VERLWRDCGEIVDAMNEVEGQDSCGVRIMRGLCSDWWCCLVLCDD
jgi:hypothetical protein